VAVGSFPTQVMPHNKICHGLTNTDVSRYKLVQNICARISVAPVLLVIPLI